METRSLVDHTFVGTSAARLKLYTQILALVEVALRQDDFTGLNAIRDDFTRWAPWAISLPLWSTLHSAHLEPSKRLALDDKLSATREALANVLERKAREVPSELLGDVSHEVDGYLRQA